MTDRRIRWTAPVAVALAAGFLAWVLLRGGDEERRSAPAGEGRDVPRAITAGELEALAAREGPLYWAGPPGGTTLELSRTPQGGIFVRYLPGGTEVGDRAGRLTVATYPLREPVQAIRRSAGEPGARLIRLDRGGVAVTNRNRPTNAYLAYPGAPVQVEVYDPRPGRAAALVRARRIVAVEPD